MHVINLLRNNAVIFRSFRHRLQRTCIYVISDFSILSTLVATYPYTVKLIFFDPFDMYCIKRTLFIFAALQKSLATQTGNATRRTSPGGASDSVWLTRHKAEANMRHQLKKLTTGLTPNLFQLLHGTHLETSTTVTKLHSITKQFHTEPIANLMNSCLGVARTRIDLLFL